MKKRYKIVLITACLIAGAYLFIRWSLQKDVEANAVVAAPVKRSADTTLKKSEGLLDLKPLFIAKLQQLVKKGSKGLYDLAIDSISVDLLQSTLTLQNVELKPDKKVLDLLHQNGEAPTDVFKASFRSLHISGINLDDVLTHKTIDFRSVHFLQPKVEVYGQKAGEQKNDPITLYRRIMNDMKSIIIGQLRIDEGSLIYHPYKKNKTVHLNHVALRLDNIKIDSSTENDQDRFLFAKKGLVSIRNYSRRTEDDLHELKIKSLKILAPEKRITLQGLSFASRYTRQQLNRKQAHQKEQYDLQIPRLSISDVDWWGLMRAERFMASTLTIANPKLKIFLDRSLPLPKSKMGAFPTQLLSKARMQLRLKKLQVNNLNLSYEEYNPRSKQSGTVYLDHIVLTATNITNQPDQIQQRRNATITASARLMHSIPLKANFVFDLTRSKKGSFSAHLTTGAFEGEDINSLALSFGLLKIEKGQVNKTEFKMQGNEQGASGKASVAYNDLKISLYEKEQDEKGLDKKGLMGLFANAFVIKNDNPKKGEALRTPITHFTRDPQAGFFNLAWKTALTGILKTIGANPKLASKK